MNWFLILSLVAADASDSIPKAEIAKRPCYRIRIEGKGGTRTYVRLARNQTVLDAVAALPAPLLVNFLTARIRVIRKGGVLEVDWRAIALRGVMRTNYLLMDGDVVEVRGVGP